MTWEKTFVLMKVASAPTESKSLTSRISNSSSTLLRNFLLIKWLQKERKKERNLASLFIVLVEYHCIHRLHRRHGVCLCVSL
jgi:hypothetical protein